MRKYVKVIALAAALLALVLFLATNSARGFTNQPLKKFLPCDTSEIIYAKDLGAGEWTAGAPYRVPQYRTETISIELIQDILRPLTAHFVYSGQRLSEKSFHALKAYAFYDRRGACLFELYAKDDTVIIHTAQKSTKLKRKKS